jgi:hypothetical protein
MYMTGKGHEHLGPGTSLVQRINWTTGQENQLAGLGSCPGNFPGAEFASDCMAMSGTCAEGAMRGLGCGGCGGKCGRECGLGLFDGGLDPSTWGLPEWGVVLLGGYMVISTVFTTKRAAGRIAAIPGEHRKRRAASYRAKAAELSKKRK